MKFEIFKKSKINFARIAEVIIVLTVLISGYLLFAYERQNNDPDFQKSWVAFYFVDPNAPEKGVTLENHLGQTTNFQFCLVPDNDNLMEPKDLSCSQETVSEAVTKNITAANSSQWLYSLPVKQGKYWVVAEYKDKDNVLKSKDLSFEVK